MNKQFTALALRISFRIVSFCWAKHFCGH